MMETIHYILTAFDGDYAVLTPVSPANAVENRVAIALLPETVWVGSKIKLELFEYVEE